MKNSIVSPSFLKQKAKQLKKDRNLSQSDALDEAAKSFGYGNYKHYLNSLEIGLKEAKSTTVHFLRSLSEEKDSAERIRLAIEFILKTKPRYQDLFDILGNFSQSEGAVQSIGEQSTLKGDVQKALLNYFIEEKSTIQALPLKEHFIAKSVFVKELTYELEGAFLVVRGDYDIEFEFEYEVPDEMKDEPHFHRDPMYGDFEMRIDREKNFMIENPAIGEHFDNQFFMGSFKLG